MVNLTPKSEKTSTWPAENPNATSAIEPRLLDADDIVAFHVGSVGS